jgi:hypothetical protein
MQESVFSKLEAWYLAQCDGEWEHSFGISIRTSDNPAWNVVIDIKGTTSEHSPIPTFRSANYLENDKDWVECRLSDDGAKFWGVGDPRKLIFIVEYFLGHAL